MYQGKRSLVNGDDVVCQLCVTEIRAQELRKVVLCIDVAI